LHRATGRKVNAQFNTGETLDAYFGRLYHQVVFGSGVQLNFSSNQQVNKDSIFYSYYGKDFSRGVSTIV